MTAVISKPHRRHFDLFFSPRLFSAQSKTGIWELNRVEIKDGGRSASVSEGRNSRI